VRYLGDTPAIRDVREVAAERQRAAAIAAAAERARQAAYDRDRLRQIFLADTAQEPSEELLESLPKCISQARQQLAESTCSAEGGEWAFGPDSDPLVQAGISECGVARMRLCQAGEEAELARAGMSATPGRKTLLIVVGAVAVLGVGYLLVRK